MVGRAPPDRRATGPRMRRALRGFPAPGSPGWNLFRGSTLSAHRHAGAPAGDTIPTREATWPTALFASGSRHSFASREPRITYVRRPAARRRLGTVACGASRSAASGALEVLDSRET